MKDAKAWLDYTLPIHSNIPSKAAKPTVKYILNELHDIARRMTYDQDHKLLNSPQTIFWASLLPDTMSLRDSFSIFDLPIIPSKPQKNREFYHGNTSSSYSSENIRGHVYGLFIKNKIQRAHTALQRDDWATINKIYYGTDQQLESHDG